jgi:hypothetical protein
MMRIIRRLAAVLMMSILTSVASVSAGEPLTSWTSSALEAAPSTLTIPADTSKGVAGDLVGARVSKAAFENARPAVRVALCGVEADAGNTGLDAGLIDFSIPDSARAAGGASDDPRDVGKNVRDYRSDVFLGVTLGYHF